MVQAVRLTPRDFIKKHAAPRVFLRSSSISHISFVFHLEAKIQTGVDQFKLVAYNFQQIIRSEITLHIISSFAEFPCHFPYSDGRYFIYLMYCSLNPPRQ